jgi:hypothetical protein
VRADEGRTQTAEGSRRCPWRLAEPAGALPGGARRGHQCDDRWFAWPAHAIAAGRSLTILHLSDVQFGKNHVFGGAGLTDADPHLDSLFVRLHDDLDELREREGVAPDAVVVSGAAAPSRVRVGG